jgi:hypothetical protein
MMRLVGIVLALILALDAIPAARAQLMLDVAKITLSSSPVTKLPLLKTSQSG